MNAVGWVLRELRPVSFNFKDGPEAKHSRYGFIAQELQQVLPGVVRGTGEEHLKVAYQDLIALLTLAAQVLQDRVNNLQETVVHQSEVLTQQTEKLTQQSEKLTQQSDALTTLLGYYKELDNKLERALAGQMHTQDTAAKSPQQQQLERQQVQELLNVQQSPELQQHSERQLPQQQQQGQPQLQPQQQQQQQQLRGQRQARDEELPATGLRHLQELEAKLLQSLRPQRER